MAIKIEHLREVISAIIAPMITATTDIVNSGTKKFNTTSLRFAGAVTSQPTPIDANTVSIITAVIPESHSHSISTAQGTVSGIPNTIPQRNGSGELMGSGSLKGSSGYKLAGGVDLTSFMYVGVGDAMFTINNANTNTSSGNNAIVNAYLQKSGQQIVLYRTYGWVCNCVNYCACQCCD